MKRIQNLELKGSHDTILMLFQNGENNGENNVENNVNRITVKREATNEKEALNHVKDCQKLIRARKLVSRGQIPENFVPGESYEAKPIESSSNFDFVTWIMVRYLTKSHLPEYSSSEKPSIPPFTATNSLLVQKHYPITSIGFTLIIPIQLQSMTQQTLA